MDDQESVLEGSGGGGKDCMDVFTALLHQEQKQTNEQKTNHETAFISLHWNMSSIMGMYKYKKKQTRRKFWSMR